MFDSLLGPVFDFVAYVIKIGLFQITCKHKKNDGLYVVPIILFLCLKISVFAFWSCVFLWLLVVTTGEDGHKGEIAKAGEGED